MTLEHLPSAAPSLARLIQELNKLPGVGPKSAQRLAYFIIRLPDEEAQDLANAINAVKQSIIFCSECQNLTDARPLLRMRQRATQPGTNLRGGRPAGRAGPGAYPLLPGVVSRLARGNLSLERHRPGADKAQGTLSPPCRRPGQGKS